MSRTMHVPSPLPTQSGSVGSSGAGHLASASTATPSGPRIAMPARAASLSGSSAATTTAARLRGAMSPGGGATSSTPRDDAASGPASSGGVSPASTQPAATQIPNSPATLGAKLGMSTPPDGAQRLSVLHEIALALS